jgi:hypothetical protein
MGKRSIKIIVGLFVLTVILFAAGMGLFKVVFPEKYFGFFPFLVLLFFIINSGFLIFFSRSINAGDSQFIRMFMLTTGIKFLAYLILVLVYILSSPQSAIPFSVTTAFLYLAYTIYDIYIMIGLVNQKK